MVSEELTVEGGLDLWTEALMALPDPIFVLTESGRYEDVIRRTDKALCKTKSKGRNRLKMAERSFAN